MYVLSNINQNNNGDIMEENINILDEINKGACMGEDAISFILDKVEDKSIKKELEKEYQEYDRITKRIAKVYPKYDGGEPRETSAMNKAMTWYGVEIRTFVDQSTSKITELLLQGVNMGIIEGRKILNNKKMNKEVYKIVSEYVKMQEASVEALKEYL